MTRELSAHTDFPDHHAVGMVVDDDALVRETVAQVLEDLCDQVYQAADQSAEENRPIDIVWPNAKRGSGENEAVGVRTGAPARARD